MSDLVGNPEDRFSHNEAYYYYPLADTENAPADLCLFVHICKGINKVSFGETKLIEPGQCSMLAANDTFVIKMI